MCKVELPRYALLSACAALRYAFYPFAREEIFNQISAIRVTVFRELITGEHSASQGLT